MHVLMYYISSHNCIFWLLYVQKGDLLQCFAQLTDWENLNRQVRYQVDNDLDRLWTDDW
jgi:hypothetical protein